MTMIVAAIMAEIMAVFVAITKKTFWGMLGTVSRLLWHCKCQASHASQPWGC
jgi:hypothetical protein